MPIKKIRSFDAIDSRGEKLRLDVFQEFVTGTPVLQGRESTIPGLKSLRTSEGKTVTQLDKGRYQVVGTGEILTSDAPDAE